MSDHELSEYYAALRGDVDEATDKRIHAALQDPDSSLSRKLRALEEARKDRPNPLLRTDVPRSSELEDK